MQPGFRVNASRRIPPRPQSQCSDQSVRCRLATVLWPSISCGIGRMQMTGGQRAMRPEAIARQAHAPPR